MATDNYIKITVGDYQVQSTDPNEIPVSINYNLEDAKDFQRKVSGQAFDIKVPATLKNSRGANTFHNPSVEDLTDGEIFRKYQPAKIVASGIELLVGKGLLKNATHTDQPTSYTWNLHGDNADWIIDLKETTLFDLLKHISFEFSKAHMEASWLFDGTDENLPYVFAPIRYRDPFNGFEIIGEKIKPKDDNIPAVYLKPSISKYWIMYYAFKSVGYTIGSTFFDSDYYRRMVMPWTWGNFLNSEGTRLDIHKFLAKSTSDSHYNSPNGRHDFIWDLKVSNDSTDGAFDNNDDYSYNAGTYAMTWQYKAQHFGTLEANFSMTVYYKLNATRDSEVELRVQWFKNGVLFSGSNGGYSALGNMIEFRFAPGDGGTITGTRDMFATAVVSPDDIITAKIHLHTFESKIGTASATANVLQFQLDFFRIPLTGIINFANYTGLKKHKFLDFFAGECDLYDLSLNTDSVGKKVFIEPTHSYSKTNDLTQKNEGFFKDDFIDWNSKADLSKEWIMDSFSDGEREQIIKFKDDSNDGLLKVVQDRNQITLAAAKYVMPERFKAGNKERENRFFGATMHYEVDQFKVLGTGSNAGIAPQMICIIPENISNTSNSESANTFLPKSAYYKGLVTGVGAWKWDGTVRQDYPFLFAVNYKDGGHNDPILSYCDEKINSGAGFILGKGLFKRFFWQRFAIMRNGQWYTVYMRLKNNDVAGQLHREYKSLKGHRWELVNIDNYQPLREDSTQCLIRKWTPILPADLANTFPSQDSVINADVSANSLDIKYNVLKCLTSDIPL